MSEWKRVRADTAFSIVMGRQRSPGRATGPGMKPYLRSANIGDGRLNLSDVKQMDFTDTETERFRLKPGDVLVSEGSASARAVGMASVWGGEVPGDVCFQNTLLRYRPAAGVTEPGFVAQWCRWAFQSGAFRDVANGTNIKHIGSTRAAAMEVRLPPLPEQRRIVDVMSAVDAQIEALAEEAKAGRHALARLIADSFGMASSTAAPIVDLCSQVIGGIWGSPEGEGEVDVLALGPRIYSPRTTDFVTDGSPVRSFSAKQVESRLVRLNDIILERSGGSPEQPVGRVVIAGLGLEPCVPTDFQRLMRPDPELVEPRYLYWRLQHDWNAGVTRSYSRKTTGITNLSVKDYIARPIPVPPRSEQVGLVARADATDAALRGTTAELARLRLFRIVLLTSVLNQDIEIPESYESLLKETV